MTFRRATLSLAIILLPLWLGASHAAQPYVPPELEPWTEWVLEGAQPLECPLAQTGAQVRRCAWPGKLALTVDNSGARFRQPVTSYDEQFVTLPGDERHWPIDVQIDGQPAPVIARNGRPHVRVGVGAVTLQGRFEWRAPPATLTLSPFTGMVALNVDGQNIPTPRWEDGTLWIRQDQPANTEQTRNRLLVTAYRTVMDGAPAQMLVTLRIDVSGESREEVLGQLLPAGFTPASMSSPLPARLDADGQLRVQARPGTWEITFTSRTPGPLASVTFQPSGENWPREEIWSYRSAPALRVTEASSPNPVDPAQAGVPNHARELPAWRMNAGDVLQIEQRQRGVGDSASNRVTLNRELWLNFDRQSYLARDDLRGTMVRDWRLDLAGPFTLQSAQIPGSSLLVTQNPDEPGQRGVELRATSIDLSAVSRLTEATGVLPVSGWLTRVDGVSTELYLPPGTRLIAAPGSDRTSGDWVGAWNLLDFFVLLIISAALWRLYAPWLGIAAFAALALSIQETNAPLWSWLFLIGAFAVHRALPDGRLRRVASVFKGLSILVIALTVVPFAANQLKLALYPQLEQNLRHSGGYPVETSRGFDDQIDMIRPMEAPEAAADARELASVSRRANKAVVAPQALNRYDKSAQVQAGPGVPTWRWRAHSMTWSGPVDPQQTFRLIVLPPFALSLWRIVMVLLVLGVIGLLIRRDPPGLPKPETIAGGAAASVILAGFLLAVTPPQVSAQTPAPQILDELKRRLLEPAACTPHCVDIERASIRFDATTLRVTLIAHAQADAALPLPGEPGSWHATDVTVDGQRTDRLALDSSGFSLPLTEGVHRVTLSGSLPNANAINLAFRVNPHRVDVDGSGFEVTGLNDGRLSGGALTLIRQRQADGVEDALDAMDVEQFPAFVTIERDLSIDLDWTVTTTVTRVTPPRAPINLTVPLIDGESVTSDQVQVTDGGVSVSLGAGQAQSRWTSTLARRAELTLTAGVGVPWQERWVINAGASWRLTHDGVPEDNTDRGALPYWRASFTPWPGETLNLKAVRPQGVDGPTLAIEAARVRKNVGRRGSESNLAIEYRATKGGQHSITLPPNAELTSVTADGRPLARTLDDDRVSLPVLPGRHQLQVQWRGMDGSDFHVSTDQVDLGIEAANLATTLTLPRDRWVLLTRGPRVGPAVLYWSELLAFVLLAFILARVARTPLKFYHWLALGLGFSTFFWPAFAVVAATVLAFRWRESHPIDSRRGFNVTQVGLALLLFGAVLALLTTIPLGLLGSPDMHVAGNNSSHHSLNWFVDRSDGQLPDATVLSAPLWLYKGLILIWSLWLAFAVLRWLPWLWGAYNQGGYWRQKSTIAVAPEE